MSKNSHAEFALRTGTLTTRVCWMLYTYHHWMPEGKPWDFDVDNSNLQILSISHRSCPYTTRSTHSRQLTMPFLTFSLLMNSLPSAALKCASMLLLCRMIKTKTLPLSKTSLLSAFNFSDHILLFFELEMSVPRLACCDTQLKKYLSSWQRWLA